MAVEVKLKVQNRSIFLSCQTDWKKKAISKIKVFLFSQNTVLHIFRIADFLISRNTVCKIQFYLFHKSQFFNRFSFSMVDQSLWGTVLAFKKLTGTTCVRSVDSLDIVVSKLWKKIISLYCLILQRKA